MNLREWLFSKRLSITYFAGLLKVDRCYVHRWIAGKQIPSEKIMKKIRELTLGQIRKFEELKDEQTTSDRRNDENVPENAAEDAS